MYLSANSSYYFAHLQCGWNQCTVLSNYFFELGLVVARLQVVPPIRPPIDQLSRVRRER